ncbi:MAG TPA: heme-dependent oxidative N-demethylase subunit alpha family protein [Fimbriimonas sp.]|nr:heme-dependent oxidative N-demethylase subunit alpha family protein [Fimbriimonas sp.]
MSLPSPARYSPWSKGVYEVAPNLRPFGFDFGNGELDRKLFQFDSEFARYRESKLRSLAERGGKYRCRQDLPPEVESAVSDLIVRRLLEDWPELFQLSEEGLACRLTGETVPLLLDDLLLQVQGDAAVVCTAHDRDWVGYVNVCNPSHWRPTDKIGLSFFESHLPVPGFERINAVAPAMVDAMVRKGPFVRFVWGLESDDRLNHHLEAPPGEDEDVWYGRRFEEGLFVRTERQTLWPLPEVGAALFVIRVYVRPADEVRRDPGSWDALVRAVDSMSPAAKEYKGLTCLKLDQVR